MSKVNNIYLTGVGGQGTILASKIISAMASAKGMEVKMSEIHGMSQRGGSVVTQVRFGDEVYSPVIEKGQADFIVASELLEGWRWIPYLKKGGTIIVSTQKINPLPVILGSFDYPAGIIESLKKLDAVVIPVDALALAEKHGQPKAANVVLLGSLFREMQLPEEEGVEALQEVIPSKFIDVNLEAFKEGYRLKY